MPWILAITLVVGALLLAISYHIGRALSGSMATEFGYPLARVRRTVWGLLLYFNLLPLAALGAFLIGGRSAISAFAGTTCFLAGHTHGGGFAFGIPGVGVFSPASFESKYISGLYAVDILMVSVTNGLGFALGPIRFNAPAEITILRLRS